MGSATPPKTHRNLRIYQLFSSGKATRKQLMKTFNISERRFYAILEWIRKMGLDNDS